MDSSDGSSTIITSSSSSYVSSGSKATSNGSKNFSSTLASRSGRVIHVEDINDENLLREMWVEASDGESKRQIRSRMYRLREERLKDFYNREGILENILKEEHNMEPGAGGEKAEAAESRNVKSNGNLNVNGNGNTATSCKTVTTVVGNGNGVGGGATITTTTTKTTSNTLTSSHGHDNDDSAKDLKSRINHQKEKISVSRKQSQEQQAKIQTTSQKVKSTSAATVVSRKNSDMQNKQPQHVAGNRNGDLLETKSKQYTTSTTTKANGTHKSNVQHVDSNKLSVGNGKAANGHSELIRRSSHNNESSSPAARNGHIKSESKNASVTTSATATRVEIKSKLSSSSNGYSQSNKNEKPPLVKKTSSSLHKEEVHRTASGSVRKTVTRTSSNSTSTANSIKLAKGLHSPPVTKKETKVGAAVEKSTTATPRFMSSTKSREIGIASTQQQFPTISVNLLHRQDSGKRSSKVNVTVTKSLSNGSAKKEKPLLTPKHSTGSEARATRSREGSPMSSRTARKAKEEKIVERTGASKVSHSQSMTAVKKDVATKASGTSSKTDESIIRRLDNLDNYLYQRSKSIEDKSGAAAVAASSPTPSAMIIEGESESRRKPQYQVESSKTSITASGGAATTGTKQKRNNSGGTHAKQIGADENDASMNKGAARSNPNANNAAAASTMVPVDVLVSGVEPKVTKSKAYSLCLADEKRRAGAVDDGDSHETTRRKQAKSNGSNNAERREKSDDETKSNTRSSGSVQTTEKVKGKLLVSSSNNGSKHVKSEDTGVAAAKIPRYKKTQQTDEMSQAETQTTIPTGTIESKREATASSVVGDQQHMSSARVWSDAKMQSQQEKYDADILSRPSVFDKRKLNESGPQGPRDKVAAAGQTLAKEKNKDGVAVEQRQHKSTAKETRKDYNDNEKKHESATTVVATADVDDEDEDDNPLKAERRFSGQRRNLESPGAVLKAKSLFENKAHEASLDKPSGGFTLSTGTSFRVNRKAAIFEAKSRGERHSVSSESSSHVDTGNESAAVNEVAQKTIDKVLVENTNTVNESKKTVAKTIKSNLEFNADCSNQTASTPSRRRSSADMLEAIEDVNQLEAMLYQATDYDERSRIRARIRIIKRQTNLGKGDAREKTDAGKKKVLNRNANEASTTFTSTKKSYVSRKSSEEVKTPQRKRSTETAGEQENGATTSKKSANRKASDEVATTKECGGVSIVAMEAKRTQKSSRKLSGEIKSKNYESQANGDSSRSGSPRNDSCFERLYSTATVSSANMFSEVSVNNHPAKPASGVTSPKSLSRKSSEKEDIVESETVAKERQRSGEKKARKPSGQNQSEGDRASPVTAPAETEAGSGKRRRYSSNKSSEVCAIHGTVVEEEVNKIELRRTPSVEKSSRRPSGRNEDAEVLSLEQLKDIQTKLRERASAEKEIIPVARKTPPPKKDDDEKRERLLPSVNNSIAGAPEKGVTRKISTEEKETSSGNKSCSVRKSSSKELKVAQEKSKAPESKKSSDGDKVSSMASTKVTTETSSKSNTVVKASGSNGNNSGRRPSNGNNRRSALPVAMETNANPVTSSYGVGPVDDDGTPLFGLRALRKIKQSKEQQDNTITSTVVSTSALPNTEEGESVDIRRSDLYGLRALKKNHDVEDIDSSITDKSNAGTSKIVASSRAETTSSSTTAVTAKTSNSHQEETDSPISDDDVARKKSPEPVDSDAKQSSPTPPPTATSPKSILKKTSSFSSNKSESKPDLNTEQKQSLETGTITSTYLPSRLDSPSIPHSTRSRSSSSDDDWKRKSSGTHGSNSMTNLNTNNFGNFNTFSRGRVGHSSVKEMSKRFEKTEASVDGVVSHKAEHSTRHVLGGPNKDFNGSEVDAEDTERGNVVYTKHSRIQKVELKGSNEHDDEYEDQFKEEIGGEVDEENGTIVKVTKNTTTTRSFLSDHSPATNLADVLERMKGEQQGQNAGTGGDDGEQSDSAAAGRNLLNKFIGAQILLAGVEPLLKASADDSEAECRTTTTATMSHSLVINGVDIDQEADSDKLRRLLEDCDGAEERGRIEQRLKTLGSSVVEAGAGQTVTSSSKVVRTSSKQSSASADVTVESKKGKGGEEMTTVTASAVESKKQQQSEAQCKVQSKSSANTMQSSGADGSTSTKTVKQQSTKSFTSFKSASSSSIDSATASVSASSSSSASPFSKFKQLDQQNSSSSSTTAANKGGGPIFKFTNEALKSSATSAKDVLLYWCQCRVRDYQNVKIENFSSSWSDGLAFCALIHHFYPDAFDYNKLEAKNRRHNFDLAFRVAEEKADIYPLLDVEDMMVMGKRPDWKCVFTYVQSMYRKLKDV